MTNRLLLRKKRFVEELIFVIVRQNATHWLRPISFELFRTMNALTEWQCYCSCKNADSWFLANRGSAGVSDSSITFGASQKTSFAEKVVISLNSSGNLQHFFRNNFFTLCLLTSLLEDITASLILNRTNNLLRWLCCVDWRQIQTSNTKTPTHFSSGFLPILILIK